MHSSLQALLLAIVVGPACGASHPNSSSTDGPAIDAVALEPWRTPTGWMPEVIAFPLSFAPELGHQGVEELRFPPGVFDVSSTNYWSYAFVWRTDDSAMFSTVQLGAELTAYYRGLLTSVDTHQLITSPESILAQAAVAGSGFSFTVHLFDAFNQAQPVDVSGSARRIDCGAGAVWVFDLSPASATAEGVRAELDALAAEAACGQLVPPTS